MFKRSLGIAVAALGSLAASFDRGSTAAQALVTGLGDINPNRMYGPRVITHKNIGRSYGCTLRRMRKSEMEAIPMIERQKGPRGVDHIFLTHQHKRRHMPHSGAKEAARHAKG